MDGVTHLKYFLGANSAHGFHSEYGELTDAGQGDFLWVLKGGPGCGKSTFMKRVAAQAQAAGLQVEHILCSGDPGSLDAIYIPALGTAYMDGTAPHVMEPPLPGAAAKYLDLSAYYDDAALRSLTPELAQLNARYKALYAHAYGLLAAADAAFPGAYPGLITQAERRTAIRRATGLIGRIAPRGGTGGTMRRRFVSSVGCAGEVWLTDTIRTQCTHICALDDEYGLAADYLNAATAAAQERGCTGIVCLDPLRPDRPEALLLPELSTAFVAVTRRRPWQGETWRHVRLDALIPQQRRSELRARLRTLARLRQGLLDEAIGALRQAKALHDELERIYNPHVDFGAVTALAARHAARLLHGVPD